MPSKGKFGLWTDRWPFAIMPIHIGVKNDGGSAQQREDAEKRKTIRRELNAKSEEVREEIETRLWASMYLQYLVKRINATERVRIDLSDRDRIESSDRVRIESSDLPDIQSLRVSDEGHSPSVDDARGRFQELPLEIQRYVLEQRRKDARIGTEATWVTLDMLIHQLTSGITDHPSDGDIAFRIFNDDSQARYFQSRGDIRCGNWQDFNIKKTLQRESAKAHIKGDHTPTDYISVSTSPRRLWNLLDKKNSQACQTIAVIDLRILRRLGIAYGSTTDDLGFQYRNRTEFATKHHALVLGWIPSHSILGFLSNAEFRELLHESQIDTSLSAG
ncbi:hypothetical protein G7046_g7602 [Stylonectria norvegica]|nr:hypothetical protein G7046_g7602 [Stylonectria norvegica]